MFGEIKLSARRALLGEELRVFPGTLALMFSFIFFSLFCGMLTLIPRKLPDEILAGAAAASVPAALLVISSIRHKMQIKYLILYSGSRERAVIGIADALNAALLDAMLFFIKLFYYAAFEAIPAFAAFALIDRLKREPMSLRACIAIACGICAAAITGFLFAFVAVQKFSRAGFCLAAFDAAPLKAIKCSIRKTKGKLLATAVFKAGFLPWLLLCAAGLPALWIIPYYKTSLTGFFIEC